MTQDELDEQLERSVAAFGQIPKITDDLAESLVSQGFFSFEDLSVIEPDHLKELSGLSDEDIEEIVSYAEREAEREEQETDRRKAIEREAKRVEKEAAELDAMTGNRLGDEAESTPDSSEVPTGESTPANASDSGSGPAA